MKNSFAKLVSLIGFLSFGACSSQSVPRPASDSRQVQGVHSLQRDQNKTDFLELEKDFDQMSDSETFDGLELSSSEN